MIESNRLQSAQSWTLTDWAPFIGDEVDTYSVQRGEVVRVFALLEDGTRITRWSLIVGIRDDSVQIMLINLFPEFLTSTDVQIPASLTRLPFDIVIETDLVGSIFKSQIDRSYGLLSPSLVDACLGYAAGGELPEISGLRSGLVVKHEFDERWTFKEGEARVLMAIKGDYLNYLLSSPKDSSEVTVEEILRKNNFELIFSNFLQAGKGATTIQDLDKRISDDSEIPFEKYFNANFGPSRSNGAESVVFQSLPKEMKFEIVKKYLTHLYLSLNEDNEKFSSVLWSLSQRFRDTSAQ